MWKTCRRKRKKNEDGDDPESGKDYEGATRFLCRSITNAAQRIVKSRREEAAPRKESEKENGEIEEDGAAMAADR